MNALKDLGFESKLDLPPIEDIEIKYDSPVFNDNRIDDAEADYRYLRDKLRMFMASGEMILSKAINAVVSDPNPRGIEASSLILRNVLKISETILNLHKNTKELTEDDKNPADSKENNTITTSLVDIIDNITRMEKEKSK